MVRKRVDFNGLHTIFDRITMQGDETVTYERGVAHGTALWGAPVAITGAGTVGLAGAGDEMYGLLHGVESDKIVMIGKGNIQVARSVDGDGAAVALEPGTGVVAGANNSVVAAGASTAYQAVVIDDAPDFGAGFVYVDFSKSGTTGAE